MPNTPVRAAAEGMPTITRRNLFQTAAAASAVVAIGTTAIAASPVDADAELFGLIERYEVANIEMNRLGKIHDHFERAFFAGKPEKPKDEDRPEIKVTDTTTVAELRAWTSPREGHQDAQARWKEAVDLFHEECGFGAADRQYNEALNAVSDIVDQIAETPARTSHGLIEKIRICREWDNIGEGFLDVLAEDIRRMASEAQS